MQTAELARIMQQLPTGVARMVAFTLADADAALLSPHARGQRVLELAEKAQPWCAELRRIALAVGFDSQRPIRKHLNSRPRLQLVAR